jgi:hypothetical protein
MTEQFDTYKARYKRSARDLKQLQDEVVDLRQKLRTTMRSLDNAEKRNDMRSNVGKVSPTSKSTDFRGRSSGGGGGEALAASVHELYSANQRLIERVTRSKR